MKKDVHKNLQFEFPDEIKSFLEDWNILSNGEGIFYLVSPFIFKHDTNNHTYTLVNKSNSKEINSKVKNKMIEILQSQINILNGTT